MHSYGEGGATRRRMWLFIRPGTQPVRLRFDRDADGVVQPVHLQPHLSMLAQPCSSWSCAPSSANAYFEWSQRSNTGHMSLVQAFVSSSGRTMKQD